MDNAFFCAQNNKEPPTNYFKNPITQADFDIEATSESKTKEELKIALSTSSAAGWDSLPELNDLESLSDQEVRELMIKLLISMRELKVSDLHLSAAMYPFARLNLQIKKFGKDPLAPEVANRLNTILLTKDQREEFLKFDDFDLALALDQSNRFRINLMVHKEGVAGTYRMIPNKIQSLEELTFPNPKVIYKLLDYHNGLILVTGPVGHGKSTTLAALVDAINNKRHDHIITVEDPIEIVQTSKQCNITQRQVGLHTRSFATALKAALREDPDIIVIGELRDLETIEMAITASETGHLVIGTLHTSDATSTLNRLLDVFPPSQQQQIRSMTAESLKGIICQRLIPNVNGGLTLGVEILINNFAIASNIRENKMHQIKQLLETGIKRGMCTMDQSVFNLFEKGIISADSAKAILRDSSYITRIKG